MNKILRPESLARQSGPASVLSYLPLTALLVFLPMFLFVVLLDADMFGLEKGDLESYRAILAGVGMYFFTIIYFVSQLSKKL